MKIKKNLLIVLAMSLIAVVLAGCAEKNEDVQKEQSNQSFRIEENYKPSVESNSKSAEKIEEISEEEQRTFKMNLLNVRHSAKYGKIINCKFKDGETSIYDIEKELGKADKTDYVEDAKGTYSTYSDYNLVFGWNKGGQLFEIRTMSPLSETPYFYVVEILGEPDYTADVNGEKIIGYKVNDDYKLLFVFEGDSINAKVDHYSVLYPAGTVNSMKGDPGREW